MPHRIRLLHIVAFRSCLPVSSRRLLCHDLMKVTVRVSEELGAAASPDNARRRDIVRLERDDSQCGRNVESEQLQVWQLDAGGHRRDANLGILQAVEPLLRRPFVIGSLAGFEAESAVEGYAD